MISLVVFTRRRDIMGDFVNSGPTDAAAMAATALILRLNLDLLRQTFGVELPLPPAS